MYTTFGDLCTAIKEVDASWGGFGGGSGSFGAQSNINNLWISAVITELASGAYLWQPWDDPDGCSTPRLMQVPQQFISDFTLAPNPFSESFQLAFHTEGSQAIEISMFDMTGKRILYQKHYTENGGYQQIGRLGKELAAGLYYLRVGTAYQQINRSVIKN